MWAMNGNDWLERKLHQAPAAIPDDGFTERVMGALPGRRPRATLRSWIILAAAVVAFLVGYFFLHVADGVVIALQVFLSEPFSPVSVTALSILAVVLGMVVWGTVALARDEM